MKKKFVMLSLLSVIGMALTSYASAETSGYVGAKKFAYFTDFNSVAEYTKAGSALNAQITGEGMVLLKNAQAGRSATLPLSGVKKISVFGKNSVDLQYGGGGSGSGSVKGEVQVDIQKSLEMAGYEVNQSLIDFYKDDTKSGPKKTNGNSGWTGVSEATVGETDVSLYDDELKATFDDYKDAAVVLLARGGTEGVDCKTYDARDHKDDPLSTKHYLELSKNESDM
nr:glycoside hydrolase family 3 C-terminal domain-containing protein [Bacilli bacterium]